MTPPSSPGILLLRIRYHCSPCMWEEGRQEGKRNGRKEGTGTLRKKEMKKVEWKRRRKGDKNFCIMAL